MSNRVSNRHLNPLCWVKFSWRCLPNTSSNEVMLKNLLVLWSEAKLDSPTWNMQWYLEVFSKRYPHLKMNNKHTLFWTFMSSLFLILTHYGANCISGPSWNRFWSMPCPQGFMYLDCVCPLKGEWTQHSPSSLTSWFYISVLSSFKPSHTVSLSGCLVFTHGLQL